MWFVVVFAVIYPCRCHHDSSLMVVFLVRWSWWPCRCHHDSSLMVVFLVRWSWWPCRCHHDSSLMVVFLVRLVAMQMLSIIADYSLVFRCGSWSCSLMVVFSHGGSQICSREDVIMIVLSWWFVRSFAAVKMSSIIAVYSQL